MKSILFSVVLTFFILTSFAQQGQLITLPLGSYELPSKNEENKWEQGNIIIVDQTKYKTSSKDEVGEYRFSVTAQRLFFLNGPLKHFYARTSLTPEGPAIILPISENEHTGFKMNGDVWYYYKH
ncbi:MAG: hypothetical protein NVS1B13_24030 [Flavisolibacter sp.]